MSWTDRASIPLTFTSPSGLVFNPLWKGDTVDTSKRVGRYSYPGINGETAQDMGLNALDYTFTLYFDDDDHDKTALKFQKAMAESGVWTVVHPVDGTLALQPLSCNRDVQPVNAANYTKVDTTWFKPMSDTDTTSTSDLSSDVSSAADDANDSLASDFSTNAFQDAVSKTKALYSRFTSVIGTIKSTITTLNSDLDSVLNTINETLAETPMDLISAAGNLISLIQSSSLITGSITSKIDYYKSLGESIIASITGTDIADDYDINTALVNELALGAIQIAMALTVISDTPDTRAQAVTMLSEYLVYADEVNAAMDAMITASEDNYLPHQYFGSANNEMLTLNKTVSKYLQGILFDLKTETTIKIGHAQSTFSVAIEQYSPSSASEADDYYDLLCESNKLYGSEILLLPAGKEIVIYV